MKRSLLLAIVGALMLSAAPVLADEGFYVIGAGGKPLGTPITSLPCTINESGMYYLSRNLLILLQTGSAITINANNVTLDLMGFTLNGLSRFTGSAHGIWINAGKSGVEVRNGCITNFAGDGVHCLGDTCRIIGLRVTNVGAAGISENGQNQVISCFASGCGHEGIWSGGQSMLKGNTVNGNAMNGITAGDNCTVVGNSAYNNTTKGISVGQGALVQGNQVSVNGTDGIATAKVATVIGNTAQGNYGRGISTDSYCSVIANSAGYNVDKGIRTDFYCTIVQNSTSSVGTMGMEFGDFCLISNNSSWGSVNNGQFNYIIHNGGVEDRIPQ